MSYPDSEKLPPTAHEKWWAQRDDYWGLQNAKPIIPAHEAKINGILNLTPQRIMHGAFEKIFVPYPSVATGRPIHARLKTIYCYARSKSNTYGISWGVGGLKLARVKPAGRLIRLDAAWGNCAWWSAPLLRGDGDSLEVPLTFVARSIEEFEKLYGGVRWCYKKARWCKAGEECWYCAYDDSKVANGPRKARKRRGAFIEVAA